MRATQIISTKNLTSSPTSWHPVNLLWLRLYRELNSYQIYFMASNFWSCSGEWMGCNSLVNRPGPILTMSEMGFYDMSLAEEGRYSLTQSTRLKSRSFEAREV